MKRKVQEMRAAVCSDEEESAGDESSSVFR
jgi:hypothetical protein